MTDSTMENEGTGGLNTDGFFLSLPFLFEHFQQIQQGEEKGGGRGEKDFLKAFDKIP